MTRSLGNGKVVQAKGKRTIAISTKRGTKIATTSCFLEFQQMTPKPFVKHLKVFGSLCYLHVSSIKKGKLDERAEKGVFIGYAIESKGYRIYSLS